jgi:predicted nucleic acid-binding protein
MGAKTVKLIDTSAWVEYLRPGLSEVGERVEALILSDDAAWCDIVLLDLWNGARGQAEKRKLQEMETIAHRLETSDEVWDLARRLAARCREKGKTIPAIDILVAACAAHHNVGVEHRDTHFEEILPLAKAL